MNSKVSVESEKISRFSACLFGIENDFVLSGYILYFFI